MNLQFFGREAGFGNLHNSAYFVTEDQELVIIDCPENTYQAVRQMGNLNQFRNIVILITHMHDDHKGALGILVQYAYYVYKKIVTIIAPSIELIPDIVTNFEIGGIEKSMYTLVTTGEEYLRRFYWFKSPILTDHAPQLANKCFGYHLNVNGYDCVYTGDTRILEPFIPLLKSGTEFYVDVSVFGGVHLKIIDCLEKFIELTKQGVKVFLMHLDDIPYIENLVKDYPDINIVTVAENFRPSLASFSTSELEKELKRRELYFEDLT